MSRACETPFSANARICSGTSKGMMEAEKGSVELVTACILHNGVKRCSPLRTPGGQSAGRRRVHVHTHIHGSAHSRARPISTHIVSNLCNALQFLVRRRKFNPACEFQQAGACANWV